MIIKIKLTFKLIKLVKIKNYLSIFNKSMENTFSYEDIYKTIYFSNILTVLVGSKRRSPNTVLKTNCPKRKT